MSIEFLLVLAAFFLTHAVPMAPKLRGGLIDRFGRGAYFAAFGLISTILLIWLFIAAARAPYVPLWSPWHGAPFLGMPLVLWLIVEGIMQPNALSLGRTSAPPRAHGLAPLTRHPLPLALAIWAGLHVLANPDLSHVILFGLLGGFSVLSMWMIDRRKQAQMGAMWHQLATGSARCNPLAVPLCRPGWSSLLVTVGLYAAAMALHPWFAGVAIL